MLHYMHHYLVLLKKINFSAIRIVGLYRMIATKKTKQSETEDFIKKYFVLFFNCQCLIILLQ